MSVYYDLSKGVRLKYNTTLSFYVNNSLTRTVTFTQYGIKTNSSTWMDGNLLADTNWLAFDGTLLFWHNYNYSSVLSGGFYGYGDR
jgi:hypothetical protein